MTLPEGWVDATIGETADLIRGVTYDKESAQSEAQSRFIPIARATNIGGGRLDRADLVYVPDRFVSPQQMLCAGDILIATSSGSRTVVGKAARVEAAHEDMSFGAFCGVIRAAVAQISDWLTKVLAGTSYRSFVESVAIGTNINNLRSRDLLGFTFPLPPEAEQRRIVAKLDALLARLARARAELSRVPVLAKKLRRIALAECFNFKNAEVVDLKSRLLAIEAGKNMRCVERPPRAGERGVVKVSAVTWGRFDPDQSKTLPPDYIPPEKARIKAGDLLISRANTLELVGATALVVKEPSELFLSDKILRLVVDDSDKRWIMWFLRSPQGRAQIENLATGNQLSMRNISQDALRRIRLPFPEMNIREGRLKGLEATLSRVERLESEGLRARALIYRLESAILAKALRGELVAQDPNDEPAAVLLDHIRTLRGTAAEPKRRRRVAVTSSH